jgi:arylsulfatase A-like enzyme
MNLSSLFLRLLVASVFPVAAAAAVNPDKPSRPNILLIISDDQGYGDSTSYWNTDLQTPVMDQIGREGIRFTHFRVNPLCAPTRASVMTGLYSVEIGMWRGPGEGAGEKDEEASGSRARRVRDEFQFLPQYLKAAGYATGIFGKWHLAADAKSVPNARGFDEFVGFLGGAHPYTLANNSRIQHNGKPLAERGGHTTDLFADRAIEFIKQNRDRPFFCYVPFNAVHGPLYRKDAPRTSAKPEWLEYYEKRGIEQPRRDYNAVMTHADHRIGDILKTLRDLGIEQNTLVIYHSDNGGILHTYPSNNGPLRGGKGDTYEGGIRVPAVMKWPGVIPPGAVSSANAVHFDLFPTILEAAGVPVPEKNGPLPVRGISLLPLAKSGGAKDLPDRYLFWDLYGDCGALRGDWKLVGEIGNHHGRFERAAEEAARTRFELYNLKEDIGEKTDVSDKFPEIYRDLKERHLAWLREQAGAATASAAPETESRARPRRR